MFHTRRRREMTKWLQPTGGRRHRRRIEGFRPHLEILEDRTVPTLTIHGLTVSAVESVSFSGTVAIVTESDLKAMADDFSATINWGDGTPTVSLTDMPSANGQIIADPNVPGNFDINGIHTYAEEGQFNIAVTVINSFDGD